MKSIIIALSGGLDSATLLGSLLQQGFSVDCVTFIYGSKHNQYEINAAKNVVGYFETKGYPVYHSIIDLSAIFGFFDSALLNQGEKIPEGHYQAESMKRTVVPCRNLIFISILAGIAESRGIPLVGIGTHAGDHFIYPDCRIEFNKSTDTTIYLATDKKVSLVTPLDISEKQQVLLQAISTETPHWLTRTCYKAQEKSCGVCGSCVERLEAFSNLNLTDTIDYE